MSLRLLGLGHSHPENEITNRFLEDLDIGTSDEWILERTGIRSRRTSLALDYIRETRNADPRAAIEAAEVSNAELGASAARMALGRAGIDAEQVGFLMGGGCAPDTTSPAEACNVGDLLGIEARVPSDEPLGRTRALRPRPDLGRVRANMDHRVHRLHRVLRHDPVEQTRECQIGALGEQYRDEHDQQQQSRGW